MDLVGPWRPNTPKEIKETAENNGAYLHYNWSGWSWLISMLQEHMDTSDFSGSNDGDVLNGATCKAVAKTLEEYINKANCSPEDREWLTPHIPIWRWAKLLRQY